MGFRISGSTKVGIFRLGASIGKSGVRVRAGTRIGRKGWISASEPLVGRRRRRR